MTLIEKLEQVKQKNKDNFNKTGDRDYAVAIGVTQHCINIVKQHSEWISVDERLPEHDGTYPALADGRFGIAKFDPEYNAWLFKNFEVYELMANVTHWMPIPQPPK